MSNPYDIRTLSFVTSIIGLVLCICMLYVFKTRKTYSGFMQWTAASILNCIALGLVSYRNVLPDFVSIVVANLFIVAAVGLVVRGLELFTNRKRSLWLFVLIAIAAVILFPYFTYSMPSATARIAVLSVILAILFAYSAYIVRKYVPCLIKEQNRFLFVSLGILSVWNILRSFLTVFIEGHITDFMAASAFQGLSMTVFLCGYILVIVGLIILNFQKVEFDLSAAAEEVQTLRGIIPICSACKKIKDDQGTWGQIETYIRDRSHAEFSHGMCPDCMNRLYPDYADEVSDDKNIIG
ncbi:MAG: hypothetical protein ACD_39C01234G0001 [uncultured bacterium]|nr:MAG: hypothetical protein ACD_39C01234G0001 [uncultured bacterium]